MIKPKYKAWDKSNKIMREVSYINFDKEIVYCKLIELEDLGFGLEFDFAEIELLQFTGLKDKYDVDIYEGDYIEFDFSNETKRGFVEFKSGSFQITTKEKIGNQNISHMFGYSSSRNHKVIGNIFQDEDLLEEEK